MYNCMFVSALPDPTCNSEKSANGGNKQILLLLLKLLKGHLQPVCIAVVHFTEIICCNTENTNVISVFDNRIVSMFLLRRVSRLVIS